MNKNFIKVVSGVVCIGLSGCSSQTFYAAAKNDKGGIVSRKTFQNYGDLNGNVHIVSNNAGVSMTVTQPTGPIPVAKIAVLNKKGDALLAINEIPMMAGISNSKVNESTYNGIATIAKGIMGWVAGIFGMGAGANAFGAAASTAKSFAP